MSDLGASAVEGVGAELALSQQPRSGFWPEARILKMLTLHAE